MTEMASRTGKVLGAGIAIPLLVVVAVLASPILFLLFVTRFVGNLWHVGRLQASWPSGKFVLLAYTESELWAPYIERELLPQIEAHCVAVNRSREDWKRRYRAEHRALAFWGGWRSYNPIAIVLRPWGRIRVFRFYEPFKQLKHGDRSLVEAMSHDLVQCVRDTAEART